MQVLTLQSLLPVFFSGAVLSYALCQFDVVCSPVQEHFIMEVWGIRRIHKKKKQA